MRSAYPRSPQRGKTARARTSRCRTELFGETLERGAALLADAAQGSVALSSAVAEDRAAVAAVRLTGARFDVVTSAAGRYAGRRVVLVFPNGR
jgi:hypothetical protein